MPPGLRFIVDTVHRASTSVFLGWRQHALYLDRGMLVINKPPGLVSQPAPPSRQETRQPTSVTSIVQEFKEGGEVPWPCHRLDKQTTGALICGRNPSIQKDIHNQFATGQVERRYLAILRGGEKTFKSQSPIIETLLEEDDGNVSVPEKGKGSANAKMSETHLRVLGSSPVAPLTLVELEAKTGRRHQLRVHAAHIGAPILGDTRYASSKLSSQIASVIDVLPDNLYLHASYVSLFRYRRGGQKQKRFRLGVMAPLPQTFLEVCQRFDIPVPEQYVNGGVYVDGSREESGVLGDLDGRWLLKDSH